MRISWEDLEKYTELLGDKIKESHCSIDVIVAIASSGMPSALIISKMLGIKEICFISISLYESGKKEFADVQVKSYLCNVRDKNVLIVDDICSSGRTLEKAKEIILNESPRTIKTATSVVSARVCKNYPDFYGESIMRGEDDWISFPWDKYEQ